MHTGYNAHAHTLVRTRWRALACGVRQLDQTLIASHRWNQPGAMNQYQQQQKAVQNRVGELLANYTHHAQQLASQPAPTSHPVLPAQSAHTTGHLPSSDPAKQFAPQPGQHMPAPLGAAPAAPNHIPRQQQSGMQSAMGGGRRAGDVGRDRGGGNGVGVPDAAPNPFGQFLQAVMDQGAKGADAGATPVKGSAKEKARRELVQRGLSAKDLEGDVEDVVRSLYDRQPFLCKTDGRRFRTQKALDQHLDDLFRANRTKKEGTSLKERLWFRSQEDWLQCLDTVPASKTNRPDLEVNVGGGGGGGGGVTGEAGLDEKAFVPADLFTGDTRCAACTEIIRREFDADEDLWVFKGTVRVGASGLLDSAGCLLVHVKCYQPGVCPLSRTPAAALSPSHRLPAPPCLLLCFCFSHT